MVYVPYYDPSFVYGGWAYPDYPPYYFAPPAGYAYGPVVAGIGFGAGYSVFGPFWGWDDFDWRRHRVHIDRDRYGEMDRFHRETIVGDTWQHDSQMGNQTVVPQSRPVTPQVQPVQPAQPRVATPPPQNRGVEQDRRLPNGGQP